MSSGIRRQPVIWAEFCILRGNHEKPEIHARLDLSEALVHLLELLGEAQTPEAAKAIFLKDLERWVRSAG